MLEQISLSESNIRELAKETYIFLGPPTSGKSTLGKIFGGILDASIIRGKHISPELSSFYEKDRLLIPDELYVPALTEYLKEQDVRTSHSVVFDNIPRTVEQAIAVCRWGVDNGFKIRSILLHLEEDEVVSRFEERRVCKNCDTSYHPKLYPATSDGRCLADGAELVKRPGDRVEEIRRGYQNYEKLLETVMPVLYKEGEVVKIDASGTILETSQILAARLGLRFDDF